MLANADQSSESCQSSSISDIPSLFFRIAGMEQETEIDLPLVTLVGTRRSLPEFGETGTVTFININNPHAMLPLCSFSYMKLMANRKTHWFVLIFVFSFGLWVIHCVWGFWVGVLSGGQHIIREMPWMLLFDIKLMINCALNLGSNSTQLKRTLLLCIVEGIHFGWLTGIYISKEQNALTPIRSAPI